MADLSEHEINDQLAVMQIGGGASLRHFPKFLSMGLDLGLGFGAPWNLDRLSGRE